MLMVEIVPDVVRRFNTELKVAGILPNVNTKEELRSTESQTLLQEIIHNYKALVFDCVSTNPIRKDTKVKEAAGKHMPVCFYAPSSNGSKDYEKVTQEFIKRVQ